jgi:hypothetical protein
MLLNSQKATAVSELERLVLEKVQTEDKLDELETDIQLVRGRIATLGSVMELIASRIKDSKVEKEIEGE